MQPKNTEFFRGPSYEEELEKVLEEHNKNVLGNVGRTFYKEPNEHDRLYHVDPVDGKRRIFPSGVPVDIGLGQPEPESIADRMRRQSITRAEAHARLALLGQETEEEANDFDVEDRQHIDPFTGYEYSEEREEDERLVIQHNLSHQKEQKRLQALEQRKAEYDEMKKHFEPETPSTPPVKPSEGG